MLFSSYSEVVEAIVLNNEITPQISHKVKKDILLPYLLEVLPSISNEKLCSRNFHIHIMKSLGLKKIINEDRHVHKRFEGIILFAMIVLFLSRLENHAYQSQFTLGRLYAEFPEIVYDAIYHLSSNFSLNHLVSVWETFYVAIHCMHIRPSGKKSALLLAANLIADPFNAMTMGGRQVMRTTLALKIFDLVSGTTVIRRKKRKAGYDKTDSEASDGDHDNKRRGRRRCKRLAAPPRAMHDGILNFQEICYILEALFDPTEIHVPFYDRVAFDPTVFDTDHGAVLTFVGK